MADDARGNASDANFDMTVKALSGELLVTMTGEFDYASAPLLRAVWPTAGEDLAAVNALRLDMAGVTFLDSAGVTDLLYAHQQAAKHGLQLSISPISAWAHRVLDIAGLIDILKVEDPTLAE